MLLLPKLKRRKAKMRLKAKLWSKAAPEAKLWPEAVPKATLLPKGQMLPLLLEMLMVPFTSSQKYSAIFAKVEGYFGIFNNQLGGDALKCSLIFVHECLESG